jgi:hypothetical protein
MILRTKCAFKVKFILLLDWLKQLIYRWS